MQVLVKKWGNSAALRIPGSVMEAARLRLDQAVDVREEDGRVVIEAVRETVYDLDTLIGGMDDGNRHEAIETGEAVGREIW